jgi:hypothetical protein
MLDQCFSNCGSCDSDSWFLSQKANRQANTEPKCELHHECSAARIQAARSHIACGNSANKVLKICHAANLAAAQLTKRRQHCSGPIRLAVC